MSATVIDALRGRDRTGLASWLHGTDRHDIDPFPEEGKEALLQWALENLSGERPCGGVCVTYTANGERQIKGKAYAGPTAARGLATRRSRAAHAQGIDAQAVLLEATQPDWAKDIWSLRMETTVRCGVVSNGLSPRKAGTAAAHWKLPAQISFC